MFEFDNIINKEKIEDEDKIEDIYNKESKFETVLYVEKAFNQLKETESIQLERRGYFYVDKINGDSGILHYVPDGKSKAVFTKIKPKVVDFDAKKAKKQEKKPENKEKKEKKKDEKKNSRKGSEVAAENKTNN